MVARHSQPALVPPEMQQASDRLAHSAAQLTRAFLGFLLSVGTLHPKQACAFSFLLKLGAALQVLVWENGGHTFHRECGLPGARELVLDTLKSISGEAEGGVELFGTVLRLSLTRFAWSGQLDVGADLALEVPEDDQLLDAVADWLWKMTATQPQGN